MNYINDNNKTKEELLIELRAYTNLIQADGTVKAETKYALSAILQILKLI
jgi:hypothetical protein